MVCVLTGDTRYSYVLVYVCDMHSQRFLWKVKDTVRRRQLLYPLPRLGTWRQSNFCLHTRLLQTRLHYISSALTLHL